MKLFWELVCLLFLGFVTNWLWGPYISIAFMFVTGFIMGVIDGLSKGGN